MAIIVKSGFNILNLALDGDETVGTVYQRAKTALNIASTDNLRVIVDGDSYDFCNIESDYVGDGSTIEFVKQSGSKAQ